MYLALQSYENREKISVFKDGKLAEEINAGNPQPHYFWLTSGHNFAWTDKEGALQIKDLDTGKVKTIEEFGGLVSLSANGSHMLYSLPKSKEDISIYDFSTGTSREFAKIESIGSVQWNPDLEQIAIETDRDRIRLYGYDGKVNPYICMEGSNPMWIMQDGVPAVIYDGKQDYSRKSKDVRIFRKDDNSLSGQAAFLNNAHDLMPMPGGKFMFQQDKFLDEKLLYTHLAVYDLNQGKSIAELASAHEKSLFQFSSDGNYVIYNRKDGLMSVRDIRKKEGVDLGRAIDLSLSPDDRLMAFVRYEWGRPAVMMAELKTPKKETPFVKGYFNTLWCPVA
ncbi:MAG: hypothetical protein HGA85_05620 [Nanoarchaeota archaeon]|nr:hypothetical protein [Nanoarchaeota archaeon]